MNCVNIDICLNFSTCNNTVVVLLNSKTSCIRISEILEAFYMKFIRFRNICLSYFRMNKSIMKMLHLDVIFLFLSELNMSHVRWHDNSNIVKSN